MTLTFRNFDGVPALDQQQFAFAMAGTGWLSGLAVSLDEGLADIAIDADAGEVAIENVETTVDAGSVTLPDGDVDWPRQDVIYADGDGNLASEQGTPRDPVPSGAVARRVEKPEPPDLRDTVGVPLAVVWVPAGASDADDIDANEHIRDRRLRPWPARIDEVVRADDDASITGDWTFTTTTTFDRDIVDEAGNQIYDWADNRIGDDRVQSASIQSDSVGPSEVDEGPLAITALSPKAVELDASGSGDNEYSDGVFVPVGATATLYAWGAQPTDGSSDTDVELRFVDPAGSTITTETGDYADDESGIATYENTGSTLDVVTVELVNTGSTAYTADSADADGVFVAHSVRVVE